jgi:glycosyltransferase involved in cell wall biosynthesis
MSPAKESITAQPGTIAFVVPYPMGIAPGQRFRFEHYLQHLKQRGFQIEWYPFLQLSTHAIIYKPGNTWKKALGVLDGYRRRLAQIPRLLKADWIFIYREAAPLGPPVFEWLLGRLFHKRIIYDFDDAIWLPAVSLENRWITWLKFPAKVRFICSISHTVSVGNHYLEDFARQYGRRVQLNPTVLDTLTSHLPKENVSRQDDLIRIGWTGSHSTLPYLNLVESVLQQIEDRYPNVEVFIIADQPPNLNLTRVRFCPWSKTTEVDDLNQLDIGIMPLSQDEWSMGKCGFKALQYMSVGIPVVASPVGVNRDIIDEGVNGFLCSTESEWLAALSRLIEQPLLRREMGAAGRQRVSEHYSVSGNADLFCGMFTNSSIMPKAIT